MYHKISGTYKSGTSVTVAQLERHFQFILENNFTCIRLADLINPDFKFPGKPLLITFDDGYLNNFELLYPMLIKYKLHASIMLPVKYIGLTSEWETEPQLPLMDFEHLHQMDAKYVEFGLHSFGHKNYNTLTTVEVAEDLTKCFRILLDNQIPFLPVLAYPFGAYPRKQTDKQQFFSTLEKNGILAGLRIGNRYNQKGTTNRFELKRIDIKGTDSFWAFKTKLKKGRVRMF
jgi:peptidoglycan/xylan/chitin deacetylase (PgdA/CDA1 family)